ncbi:MAG: trypsin-like peptidase domain-containing protein, partial [Chloroflexota bacterium]|nr:trypsin-like peptidase domain-containing protein [Chloroflexota bacterium]
MPGDKLKQNVALVRGEMAGTGFFIGSDGSLLTCFHVVGNQETGNLTDRPLTVTYNTVEYPAECICTPSNPRTLDVAVLRLADGKLPPGAALLPLGKWKSDSGQKSQFRTFGFRPPDVVNGLHARGKIRGRISTKHGMQLLQFSSEAVGAEEIRQGMSGAPVYHDATGQVVGMVVLLIKETGETIPCAVPIEAIADIWLPVKERLRETELLQQLLKVFQPGEWFTAKTFKSFYESLPSSRLVKYDELGEDKPQALLEQLRGQRERVYDFVNCIRAKRPDIPLTELIDLPPVQRINFVNRKDELEETCERYALPYILFEAPAGYGKTELLKAIEQRHFRDDWLSIYVETSQNTVTAVDLANQVAARAGYSQDLSHLPDTRAVGYTLAGFLDDRLTSLHAPGVILLIDSIERLPEGEIDAFVNHFLFAVHSVLHKVNLRVHLAGRYIGSTWEKRAREFQFTVKPLTPFHFRYVKDTVRSLLPSQEKLDLYAAHLMHVTGGHPGCMAKII